MRAIAVKEFGGPDVLQVMDMPPEPLGSGQVRIRVAAATVNPADIARRSGRYAQGATVSDPPSVPGMEAAGVLTEVAPDADTSLAPGDHVMAFVAPDGAHGAHREDVVVPARSVARVPAGVSDVAAATLPMNGLTARQALDLLGLQPGDVLAVSGAAGAFGGYVVQLAKADGLTVVADAAAADEELVRRLGADIVVRRGEGVADRIREHFSDGVDGAADGAGLNDALTPAVREGGRFVSVRGWTGDNLRGVEFFQAMARRYAENVEALDQLRQLVEDGAITLRVARTFPAEQAAEAHRLFEAGGVRGRLVLTF